jgi:hypothetical protein
VNEKVLLKEIMTKWTKNYISNYDYLMFLNSLGNRTLNIFSQYYIFPFTIFNFKFDTFNCYSDSIYRNLSLPFHACGKIQNHLERIEKSYKAKGFHSGTFYSNNMFVAYFFVRQLPFTLTHLEIQDASFDSPSRMFNSYKQFINIEEKSYELIPAYYSLPELYIKTHNIYDVQLKNNTEPINDFEFPEWSLKDPRKFVLIMRKILDSKKISQSLNSWIDLIFGYKQDGPNSINSYNKSCIYCYPLKEEEKNKKNFDINFYLLEK